MAIPLIFQEKNLIWTGNHTLNLLNSVLAYKLCIPFRFKYWEKLKSLSCCIVTTQTLLAHHLSLLFMSEKETAYFYLLNIWLLYISYFIFNDKKYVNKKYLATVSRHRWSPQIAMKVDKVCSFQPALQPSSAEESSSYSSILPFQVFLLYYYYFIFSCFTL